MGWLAAAGILVLLVSDIALWALALRMHSGVTRRLTYWEQRIADGRADAPLPNRTEMEKTNE